MTPLELLELTIEDKVKGIWLGEKCNSEYKRWYSNGQLWVHISYKNDRLDGEYKCWHENGQLNVHCSYKDSKYEGEYKSWYPNGKLWNHSFYKDDKVIKNIVYIGAADL